MKINPDIAMKMAFDFLAAGIDTTGSTIRNMFYVLAINPEKQDKLRKEVMNILPGKDDALTSKKLEQLPYLRACMKEIQRMQPPVSGNIRQMQSNIVLQGYQIPVGTHVFLNHWVSSNLDENFARSKEFIPERWLREKVDECPHSKDSHPFTYMPFGFGQRSCIGKRFAELEIAVITARMVREFELSWHYAPPQIESHFLRIMKGDFRLRINDIQ